MSKNTVLNLYRITYDLLYRKRWTQETSSCPAVFGSEAEVQVVPPVVYVVATYKADKHREISMPCKDQEHQGLYLHAAV